MFKQWLSYLFGFTKEENGTVQPEEELNELPPTTLKEEKMMTPSRPFVLKAFYDWIVANNCTPYVGVLTTIKGVKVPKEYIVDEKHIILNISPDATDDFIINNYHIHFVASFNGQREEIFLPIESIQSIFAQENQRGMLFEEEDFSNYPITEPQKTQKKPKLVLVKNNEEC